jgi:hypothetical protein
MFAISAMQVWTYIKDTLQILLEGFIPDDYDNIKRLAFNTTKVVIAIDFCGFDKMDRSIAVKNTT